MFEQNFMFGVTTFSTLLKTYMTKSCTKIKIYFSNISMKKVFYGMYLDKRFFFEN